MKVDNVTLALDGESLPIDSVFVNGRKFVPAEVVPMFAAPQAAVATDSELLAKAVEVLRDIEWANDVDFCPQCHMHRSARHQPRCALAELLAEYARRG